MKIILDENTGRLYRSADPLQEWTALQLILGTQEPIELHLVTIAGETVTYQNYNDPVITTRLDIGHAQGDPPLAGTSLGNQIGSGTEGDPRRFTGTFSLDQIELIQALAGKERATLRLQISIEDEGLPMPNPYRHLAQVPITILNTVVPIT